MNKQNSLFFIVFISLAFICNHAFASSLTLKDTGAINFASITANNVILENPLHHWRVDEGSGGTLEDEVGVQDATSTDTTGWVTDAQSVGSFKFQITNDGFFASDINFTDVTTGSVVITVEIDNFNDDQRFFNSGGDPGQDERAYLGVGTNGSYSWGMAETFSTGGSASTGTKLRIGFRWGGGTISVFENGTKVIDGASYSGQISQYPEQNIGSGDSNNRRLNGTIDNMAVYEDKKNDQFFTDDYNAQPWS